MKFSACTLAAVTVLAGTDAFLPSNKISVPNLGRNTISLDDDVRNMKTIRSITKSAITVNMASSFLDNIPNPFQEDGKAPRPPDTPPPMMSNDAEALFSRARSIVASDLGLADSSILADDFKWVGPNVISTGVLSKDEYLAAGKFFNLRSTFPDLDYRAHDFRLDPKDPLTVRFTARTVGTMRGELRLRSETLQPNGVRMQCPPEAISMTFDRDSGKLVKLCSGFVMDRLVGNTGGLCGVQAAATVAGSPPSEWEVYPPSAVVGRFFGRSVKQLKEPEKVFLAPFPETVMIQLAKGVLAAEVGTNDPDLLGDNFTFCGPIVGPLDKKTFLEAFAGFKLKDAFPDLEENYANFRVDPYDPYRVWYDTKGEGTWTGPLNGKEPDGSRYIGPPEIGSMTFDDNGFCTRLTGGAVVDPTDCNTGGLGGVFGIFYATGNALPGLASRPLPQIIARAQKAATSIFTGKSVDDFGAATATSATAASAPPSPPAPKPKVEAVKSAPEPPAETRTVSIRKTMPIQKTPAAPKPPTKVKAQPKAPPSISIGEDPADPVSDAFSNLFGGGGAKSTTVESKSAPPAPKQTKPKPSKPSVDIESQKAKLRAAAEEREKAAAEKKAQAEQKRKEAEEARLRAAEEKKTLAAQKRKEAEEAKVVSAEEKKSLADQKKKEAEEARLKLVEERKALAEQKKKEAEEKRLREAEERKAVAEQKRKEAEEKRIAAAAANQLKKKEAEEKKAKANAAAQAESLLDSAKRGATISLGFFGFGSKDTNGDKVIKPSTSGAPRGVPSLTKWTQNNDGSVTGLISGSNSFPDGESITTSPMKTSNVDGDSVVVTVSGSRYYLEGNASPGGFFNFGVRKPSKTEVQPEKEIVDVAAIRKQKMEEQKAAAAAKKAEFDAARKAKLDETARKAADKKAALQAQKEEAKAKREAAAAAKTQASQKAASMLESKKGGGTISLQPTNTKPTFSFFGGGKSENKKSVDPPAGVPVINKFKQNRDGSVTGFITGSPSFREGERVTTSKLAANQKVESGNVVKTVSGSKYFLK